MVDLPDDIFYRDYDKNINLVEFSRQYHEEHHDQPTHMIEDKSNALQFLPTHTVMSATSLHNNLFVKFARRSRTHFIDYERNLFCLLDAEKKRREGFLECLLSMNGNP